VPFHLNPLLDQYTSCFIIESLDTNELKTRSMSSNCGKKHFIVVYSMNAAKSCLKRKMS
jgi:hypothetical protein